MFERRQLGTGHESTGTARMNKPVKWEIRDVDGEVYVDTFIEADDGSLKLDADIWTKLTPDEAEELAFTLFAVARSARQDAAREM